MRSGPSTLRIASRRIGGRSEQGGALRPRRAGHETHRYRGGRPKAALRPPAACSGSAPSVPGPKPPRQGLSARRTGPRATTSRLPLLAKSGFIRLRSLGHGELFLVGRVAEGDGYGHHARISELHKDAIDAVALPRRADASGRDHAGANVAPCCLGNRFIPRVMTRLLELRARPGAC